MQNWVLMHFFRLLLLVFLCDCKHARIVSTTLGAYEGLWVQGARPGCLPSEAFPGIYKRHGLRIMGYLPRLTYIRSQEFFTDNICKQLFLLVENPGEIVSRGSTQISATGIAEQIRVVETRFIGVLTTQQAANQANLLTASGLQQQINTRLCGIPQDWKPSVPVDISGKNCGLGILSTPMNQIYNLMQANGNQLNFGLPNQHNYPMMLDDDPQKTWYREPL